MKKKIVLAVLIVLLNVVIMSGCNGSGNIESDVISINELNTNLETYLNQNVTVKASYLPSIHHETGYALYQEGAGYLDVKILENVDTSIVIGVEYYWTGILRHDTNFSTSETIVTYLEVSEVQSI
jgi:hypothetical protein